MTTTSFKDMERTNSEGSRAIGQKGLGSLKDLEEHDHLPSLEHLDMGEKGIFILLKLHYSGCHGNRHLASVPFRAGKGKENNLVPPTFPSRSSSPIPPWCCARPSHPLHEATLPVPKTFPDISPNPSNRILTSQPPEFMHSFEWSQILFMLQFLGKESYRCSMGPKGTQGPDWQYGFFSSFFHLSVQSGTRISQSCQFSTFPTLKLPSYSQEVPSGGNCGLVAVF